MNVGVREPIPTRVLNPTASEASYKPKQRSYGKMKLKKMFKKIGVIILQEGFHGVTILQVILFFPRLEKFPSTLRQIHTSR